MDRGNKETNAAPAARGDARKDYSYIKRHKGNDPVLDRKIPVIELSLLGVCVQAILAYFLIRGLFIYGPLFDYHPVDCAEADFFLNQMYTIEMFNAFGAVIPVGVGLMFISAIRVFKGKKYGRLFAASAVILILGNIYVTYLCAQWFITTSGAAITLNAENALREVAKRQEQYRANNGTYAADPKRLLGDFSFSRMGSVAITAADKKGFVAEARHICLPKYVSWNSAEGGLTEKERY